MVTSLFILWGCTNQENKIESDKTENITDTQEDKTHNDILEDTEAETLDTNIPTTKLSESDVETYIRHLSPIRTFLLDWDDIGITINKLNTNIYEAIASDRWTEALLTLWIYIIDWNKRMIETSPSFHEIENISISLDELDNQIALYELWETIFLPALLSQNYELILNHVSFPLVVSTTIETNEWDEETIATIDKDTLPETLQTYLNQPDMAPSCYTIGCSLEKWYTHVSKPFFNKDTADISGLIFQLEWKKRMLSEILLLSVEE